MIDLRLENKVVLISGANHGIGAATALKFAEQGARVFITYFREEPGLSKKELEKTLQDGVGGFKLHTAHQQQSPENVIHEIQSAGGIVAAHETDLSVAANIQSLFQICTSELGPVDILVNNHTFCVMETFDPSRVTDGHDPRGSGAGPGAQYPHSCARPAGPDDLPPPTAGSSPRISSRSISL